MSNIDPSLTPEDTFESLEEFEVQNFKRPRHLLGRLAVMMACMPLVGFAPSPVDGNSQHLRSDVEIAATIRHPERQVIKVSSFNIAGGREGLDKVAEAINYERPMVVGLQEADPESLAYLMQHSNYHYGEGAWDQDEIGKHNMSRPAILSNLPILDTKKYRLYREGHHEQRFLLITELDYYGQRLVFADAHLINRSAGLFGKDPVEERSRQARNIRAIMSLPRYKNLPGVLVCDCNASLGGDATQELDRSFINTTEVLGGTMDTFATPFTSKQIDYTWLKRGFPYHILEQHTSDQGASDHYQLSTFLAFGK